MYCVFLYYWIRSWNLLCFSSYKVNLVPLYFGFIKPTSLLFHSGGHITFYSFKVAVVLNLKLEPFLFKGTKNYLLASFYSFIISSSESITTSVSLKFKMWLRMLFYGISSKQIILFFIIDLKIFKAWKVSKHLGGSTLSPCMWWLFLSSFSMNLKISWNRDILKSGR